MVAGKLQELISPDFNENVLVEILRKSSGYERVIVSDVNLKGADANKGDGYMSLIIRFTVEGTAHDDENEEKRVSCDVFVKVLPKNICRRKSFRATDFFRNEVNFYKQIWPSLMAFQDSKNIPNKFVNVPICYAALTDGENDYIALEDLSVKSYVPYIRQKEMDYNNIIQIIRVFAKFHALSFAFKDQFPKEFEELSNHNEEVYFAEKYRTWFADYQVTLVACTRDAIEKELPAAYLEKLEEMFQKDVYGQVVELCATKGKFAVFTQGDAWIPNFLAKYDKNGKAIDIKLIDFQLLRCCSLACDISFFLYACTSVETLDKYWDDIMIEYHREFTKFLSVFGTDPMKFTLDDLNDEMRKFSLLGYVMSMEVLPFTMMGDTEVFDLDAMEGDEAVNISQVFKVYPLNTSEKRQKLANAFKHAVDKGFII